MLWDPKQFVPGNLWEFEAEDRVHREYFTAVQKFPWWPVCPLAGLAIAAEEAGETTKAVLDWIYKDVPIEDAIKEAAQAAAMYRRVLEHLLCIRDGQVG